LSAQFDQTAIAVNNLTGCEVNNVQSRQFIDIECANRNTQFVDLKKGSSLPHQKPLPPYCSSRATFYLCYHCALPVNLQESIYASAAANSDGNLGGTGSCEEKGDTKAGNSRMSSHSVTASEELEQRNRLPTLLEVLGRRTLAPVDLFSFYIYMRDQQRSVDYLDFWQVIP
jgi:hypothetical protein